MKQNRVISMCSDSAALGGHKNVAVVVANLLAKFEGDHVHFSFDCLADKS